jgi:hypothetical protein
MTHPEPLSEPMPDLLPCPFCGGRPIFVIDEALRDKFPGNMECGCEGCNTWQDTPELWNQRDRAITAELVEGLRFFCDKHKGAFAVKGSPVYQARALIQKYGG